MENINFLFLFVVVLFYGHTIETVYEKQQLQLNLQIFERFPV